MNHIYIINLARRPDRLSSVVSEISRTILSSTRVEATDAREFTESRSVFISNAAYACGLSHKAALRAFLAADSDYGIIVEDDLIIKSVKKVENAFEEAAVHQLDLLQVGFIRAGLSDNFDLFVANSTSVFCKIVNRCFAKIGIASIQRLRFQRNQSLGFNLVPDDIRAGAHCYLISKRLAKELVLIIENSNNTFDGLLMSIGLNRKYRVARYLDSAASQSLMKSDIKRNV